jgi:hypothetical protein
VVYTNENQSVSLHYLVDGVTSARSSDLDDAGSSAIAVGDECSRASSHGAGGSARIGWGGAVDGRASGAHASLCHVTGGSGVQVSHLRIGLIKQNNSFIIRSKSAIGYIFKSCSLVHLQRKWGSRGSRFRLGSRRKLCRRCLSPKCPCRC